MLCIELNIPIQMQAEASVKKPEFVQSKFANISGPVISATIDEIIAAKTRYFHEFSRRAILDSFLKYTCVCTAKEVSFIYRSPLYRVILLNIIIGSALAALIRRIDFYHNILKLIDAEMLLSLVNISEERQVSRVVL